MSYISDVSIIDKIKSLARESIDFNKELTDEDIMELITDLVFNQSTTSYISANEKKEVIDIVFNSQVDYVSRNNAVGKVHAEIIRKGDEHYLKDLNSRNGTYINGERIVSNVEYVIENNDRIAFANSEYKFMQTKRTS